MGERPNVLIPSPGPIDRDFVREFRPWWQQAEEKWWGKFVPQNVRHIHDPEWRNRFWSIQAAHDRRGFWLVVYWLWWAANIAFAVWSVAAVYFSYSPRWKATYNSNMTNTDRWLKETYGRR